MGKAGVGAVILAVAVAFGGLQVRAQDDAAGEGYAGSYDAAMDLLALVPDSPIGRQGTPLVSYIDFEAMIAAFHGDPTSAGAMATPATVGFDERVSALRRAAAGPPEYLQLLPAIETDMPGLLGIGVGDVHRALVFGTPPRTGTVFGLDPQQDFSAAITAALDARGFEQRDVAGTIVRHRLSDGAMDLTNRAPGDPFGGHMGLAARIAHIDHTLVNSAMWPVTLSMVAAAGDARALADDPAVAVTVAAIADPVSDGLLLQFLLLNVADTMVVPGDPARILLDGAMPDAEAPAAQGPADMLPPYLLVALADRSAGNRDETLVALAYPNESTAEMAAPVLADRLRSFAPASAPEAWIDHLAALDATVEPAVFASQDGGPAVALARISYPSLLRSDEAAGDDVGTGDWTFTWLINAFYRRELSVLAVAP